MPRRLISTGSPFERSYGYSRAVIDEPFCFVAGTTGYDYATMKMPDGAAAQAKNAWTSIEKALTDGGFVLADIVRATYYIVDPKDAEAVLPECGRRLADIRPAATLLVVAQLLNPEMKVEIEVTAKRRS